MEKFIPAFTEVPSAPDKLARLETRSSSADDIWVNTRCWSSGKECPFMTEALSYGEKHPVTEGISSWAQSSREKQSIRLEQRGTSHDDRKECPFRQFDNNEKC